MGLSKFKSAVVLISKQFEVKATFDGMIESSFAISSLSKGYSPQKHWNALYAQEICGVRPTGFSKNEIFSRFPDERRGNAGTWTRQIGLCHSGIQQDASFCVRRFHLRLITGLFRQKSIPLDGLVNSVFLEGRGQT